MALVVKLDEAAEQLERLFYLALGGNEVVLLARNGNAVKLQGLPAGSVRPEPPAEREMPLHPGNVLWISPDFDESMAREFGIDEE